MSLQTRRDWFQGIALHEYDLVKEALTRFAGAANGLGETALMLAARLNDVEMIKILCIQEATMVNREGFTALMIAACCDNVEAVRLLVPFEKAVFLPDGRTPLMLAVEAGSSSCVSVLIEYYGAERDINNLTALDYAVRADQYEYATLIEQAIGAEQGLARAVMSGSVGGGMGASGTSAAPTISAEPPILIREDQDLRNLFDRGVPSPGPGARKLTWHEQIVVDVRTMRREYNRVAAENLALRKALDDLQKAHDTMSQEHRAVMDHYTELKANEAVLADVERKVRNAVGYTGQDPGALGTCVEELLGAMKAQLEQREEDVRSVSRALDQVMSESRLLSTKAAEAQRTCTQLQDELKSRTQELEGMRALAEANASLANTTKQSTITEEHIRREIEDTLERVTDDLSVAKNLLQVLKQGAAALESPANLGDVDSNGFTPILQAIADSNLTNLYKALGISLGTMPGSVPPPTYEEMTGTMVHPERSKHFNLTLIPSHLNTSKMLSEREGSAVMEGSASRHARYTELINAVINNDIHGVWQYMPQQAGLQDVDGRTAMMHAAQKGYTEIVRILVDKEARIQTPYGTTALMDAACNGHTSIVRILVDYEGGMATNAKHTIGAGLTALMLAAHEGYIDCVRLLVDKELHMRCVNGKDAMDYARNEDVRRVLAGYA
ncbi:Ankyrin repeat protein 3 [Giardia muris]|uniref:Ankyrin repeat protein 3 n=1 Tax=Giardia muris TaxID=5742 RepID=A0A4Z1SMX5_GIAMU|nr:Ankyrin repeat protein 3 [Giardia muris]|eukprot:TNJ26175.1 Ankyrin repeat protein 3 [Giardia muris]